MTAITLSICIVAVVLIGPENTAILKWAGIQIGSVYVVTTVMYKLLFRSFDGSASIKGEYISACVMISMVTCLIVSIIPLGFAPFVECGGDGSMLGMSLAGAMVFLITSISSGREQ